MKMTTTLSKKANSRLRERIQRVSLTKTSLAMMSPKKVLSRVKVTKVKAAERRR
jgi:hypothetical protein